MRTATQHSRPPALRLYRLSAVLAAVGFIVAFDNELLIASVARWLGFGGFGIYYVFGGPWIGRGVQDLAGIVGLVALAVALVEALRRRAAGLPAPPEVTRPGS